MSGDAGTWICCQIGGREHYAVPRALQQAGVLTELITDVWLDPSTLAGRLAPRRHRERFHVELAGASVWSPGLSTLAFEARQAIAGTAGWDLMLRRNEWFQDRAIERLRYLADRQPGRQFCVFSFSYAARRIFEFAKSRRWTTVMGQIDPGPAEERLVTRLHAEHPALAGPWQPAPSRYWKSWRDECQIADRVIVNSSWSQQGLAEEGVAPAKIRIVPLAYDAPVEAVAFDRPYPDRFSEARPLRALFLGQVILRKGMAALLDAITLLQADPVEFWIVGPRQMSIPPGALTNARVRWVDGVARGKTAGYYRDADVFLFPTLSDGFGLTQLEAQAWKLPIIASRFCGDVVADDANGERLSEVTGAEIARALRRLLAEPGRLAAMSRHARSTLDCGVRQLGPRLLGVLA